MDLAQLDRDVERIERAVARIEAANEELKALGATRPDDFVEGTTSSTESKPSGLLDFRARETGDRRKS